MKSGRLSVGLLLGAVVLLTASAIAAEKTTVETRQTMTVNGTPLPAGKYKVSWEGSGPGVELKFMKGNDVVATAPAQVVNQKTKIATNAGIVIRRDSDRVALTQIRPQGKKYVLNIGGETEQTAAENTK
jgi:hypothetical protein